jgi:hypothetical protein
MRWTSDEEVIEEECLGQGVGILSDHEVGARRDLRSVGEGVADATGEEPAREILFHRGSVVEVDGFFADGVVIGLEVNLVDDNVAREER